MEKKCRLLRCRVRYRGLTCIPLWGVWWTMSFRQQQAAGTTGATDELLRSLHFLTGPDLAEDGTRPAPCTAPICPSPGIGHDEAVRDCAGVPQKGVVRHWGGQGASCSVAWGKCRLSWTLCDGFSEGFMGQGLAAPPPPPAAHPWGRGATEGLRTQGLVFYGMGCFARIVRLVRFRVNRPGCAPRARQPPPTPCAPGPRQRPVSIGTRGASVL